MRYLIVAFTVLIAACGGEDNYESVDREWTPPAQLTDDSPVVYYDTEIPNEWRMSLTVVDIYWNRVQDCLGLTASPPDVYFIHGPFELVGEEQYGYAQYGLNRVYASHRPTHYILEEFVHIVLHQNGYSGGHEHWGFDECTNAAL